MRNLEQRIADAQTMRQDVDARDIQHLRKSRFGRLIARLGIEGESSYVGKRERKAVDILQEKQSWRKVTESVKLFSRIRKDENGANVYITDDAEVFTLNDDVRNFVNKRLKLSGNDKASLDYERFRVSLRYVTAPSGSEEISLTATEISPEGAAPRSIQVSVVSPEHTMYRADDSGESDWAVCGEIIEDIDFALLGALPGAIDESASFAWNEFLAKTDFVPLVMR